jgi:hypothetical protein
MIDQLTNKEILTIYLSLKDSKASITKGIKASTIQFNYEEDLINLEEDGEDKDEKLDILYRVNKLILDTAAKKLIIINSIVDKFAAASELIIDANPELFEQVQKILYDKEVDEEIKSILKY